MKKILIVVASCLAIITIGAKTSPTRSSKADIARNLQTFNAIYKELQTQYVDNIDIFRAVCRNWLRDNETRQ